MARSALSATRTSPVLAPTKDTRSVRVTCDDSIGAGSTNGYWLDIEESTDGGLTWTAAMTVKFEGPIGARGRGATLGNADGSRIRESVQHRFRTTLRRLRGTPAVEAIVELSDDPVGP